MDDYKIFEVKCNIIPLSSLPAEATAPIHETEFDKINPLNTSQMNNFKYRIAGVMLPKDLAEIQKIENQMQLDKNDMLGLKQEYDQCLKKCVCLELV